MTDTSLTPAVRELIERIDAAVTSDDSAEICAGVKSALEQFTRSGDASLDPSLTRIDPDGYGRRLLHLDPNERYSVVIMIWGSGQGTPIHDHAGTWCVECVYEGSIRVVSYDLVEEQDAARVRFEQQSPVMAGVGEAGSLIPPFDYHTIENPHDSKAVTVHVYGEEMNACDVFLPEGEGGDWYRRESRKLSYSP